MPDSPDAPDFRQMMDALDEAFQEQIKQQFKVCFSNYSNNPKERQKKFDDDFDLDRMIDVYEMAAKAIKAKAPP